MKEAILILVLNLTVPFIAFAASPIPLHPPAPPITASKAIQAAEKFVGADPKNVSYCSSITLNEGGMTPPPVGSARHWLITFQNAGDDRAEIRRVYVNMDGNASDTVPTSDGNAPHQSLPKDAQDELHGFNQKTEPPLANEAQAVLDDLNLKAADSAWQSSIDMIERPETRSPNTVDSGEVTAFLANSKKRLAELGVRVAWNTTIKRYEVVAARQTQAASQMTPLSYRDPDSGMIFLVESDRHHVVAVDKNGKILWSRQPATDGKLPPYSETRPCPNPAITWIGASTVPRPNSVCISFNSRQAGALDLKTGDFTFLGQD